MELRRYHATDAESVWQLHHAGLEQMGVDLGDGPWDDDLRDIEGSYRDGTFLVGLFEGRVVALGGIRRTSETAGEVRRIRIDPEFQGRGLGERMMRSLERHARKAGLRRLMLDTTAKQEPARRLFEKCGFRECGTTEALDGSEMILYEKDLL
jgi:GNAT superfamily N-acetyltransferase